MSSLPQHSNVTSAIFPRSIELLRFSANLAALTATLLVWLWEDWKSHLRSTIATVATSGVALLCSAVRLVPDHRGNRLWNLLECGALVGFILIWLLWQARWSCLARASATHSCFVTVDDTALSDSCGTDPARLRLASLSRPDGRWSSVLQAFCLTSVADMSTETRYQLHR